MKKTITEVQAGSPKVSTELVSPDTAKRYLATMKRNRNVDPNKLKEYTNLMKKGLWNKYSRYLEFTEDGDLINGQHRLLAIIASNKPQTMMIVRGLPRVTRTQTPKQSTAKFSTRTKNLADLISYGTATSNPFVRKVNGKLVTVKGRMRKALRKDMVDSLNTFFDQHIPPQSLQTYRTTQRGTLVRAIRGKSLTKRWNDMEKIRPDRKQHITELFESKVRPFIQSRKVKVKGSPYTGQLLQYKTKKGYET